jgi:Flp pilus assembly protein TadD
MRSAWVALLILSAGAALFAANAALAAPAPPAPKAAPAPTTKSQIDRWFADLAKAESAEDAKPIEDKLEAAFRQSGSPSVDLLMSRAKAAMGAADNKTAAAILTAVTKAAPQYAEGWRARATLDAAAGNDGAAMVSLQRVITINPRHFPVRVELAGLLEDYGDKKGALALYRKALALDPQLDIAARRVRALEKEVEGQGI